MLKEKLILNETPESSVKQFVWAVLEINTKLALEQRKRSFDARRWCGAWREFLRECEIKPCSDPALRKKFSITTKGGISFMYRQLCGKPKPAVFKKKRLAA